MEQRSPDPVCEKLQRVLSVVDEPSPDFYNRLDARLEEPMAERSRRAWLPTRPRRSDRSLIAVLVSLCCAAVLIVVGMHYVWSPSSTNATNTPGTPYPVLQPRPGWYVKSTGAIPPASSASPQIPVAAASTVPWSAKDVFPSFPAGTLASLPSDGIVIYVMTSEGANTGWTFPTSQLPLRLSAPTQVNRSWEGQPSPQIVQYRILAQVNGAHLDAQVYFGTPNPDASLLAEAQSELDTLSLTQSTS